MRRRLCIACILFIWLCLPAIGAEAINESGYVKTELYFGLSLKDGSQVTADEWQAFLASTITPAFKEGLTVVDAYGQYLNEEGKFAREPSKLVVLIHVPTKAKNTAIEQIIDAYKKKFQQESVLRTTVPVAVSFGTEELTALKERREDTRAPLDEYYQYNDSARENTPDSYIGWLKKSRFKNGELDHLPRFAIILEVSDVVPALSGIEDKEVKTIELGSASPNLLFVITRKTGASFIVNRGLPGAGGVQTQVAELGALGIQYVVHIGSCGLLNKSLDEKTIIAASGAYKDGAAVMLSDAERGKITPLSLPDAELRTTLVAQMKADGVSFTEGIGYTIPIYYYQPSGLIRSLITGTNHAKTERPLYLEMEQAALFETARISKIKAASLVVTSDRYDIADGKLIHDFTGDTKPAIGKAILESVRVFDSLNK